MGEYVEITLNTDTFEKFVLFYYMNNKKTNQ